MLHTAHAGLSPASRGRGFKGSHSSPWPHVDLHGSMRTCFNLAIQSSCAQDWPWGSMYQGLRVRLDGGSAVSGLPPAATRMSIEKGRGTSLGGGCSASHQTASTLSWELRGGASPPSASWQRPARTCRASLAHALNITAQSSLIAPSLEPPPSTWSRPCSVRFQLWLERPAPRCGTEALLSLAFTAI